ncbi:5316_t:CDS:2 [Diversispora eburnea]|uniref:5316_t:CDS:1 n=1 Tax=Diversispora eburnea TaxID=1213867 RepID=A0A9N9FG72_9GLOM|nr:5316_t:CDS:2 [Diversispora eburnea]
MSPYELNFKPLIDITELRKKFAEVEAENVGLKAKESGFMARIIKLEQIAENTKLRNAKLNARIIELERSEKENEEFGNRVTELEQKMMKGTGNQTSILIPKEQSLTNINASCRTNSDDTPERIVLQNENTLASDISDNTSNSDVSDNVTNSNVYQPIYIEPKSTSNSNISLTKKTLEETEVSVLPEKVLSEIQVNSSKFQEAKSYCFRNSPITRTNPYKMECLYQYAIKRSIDSEKFLIFAETEKNR